MTTNNTPKLEATLLPIDSLFYDKKYGEIVGDEDGEMFGSRTRQLVKPVLAVTGQSEFVTGYFGECTDEMNERMPEDYRRVYFYAGSQEYGYKRVCLENIHYYAHFKNTNLEIELAQ